MGNNDANEQKDRPKAPLIRSIGYIVQGVISIVVLIVILLLSRPKSFGDYLGFAGFVLIFGGYALLMFVVGKKMRRW